MRRDVALPPTPYKDLNGVLRSLVAEVNDVLGNLVVGIYLVGSFALGDFDEASDVDFLVITTADIDAEREQALNAMHQRLFTVQSGWAQHLEGSYAPTDLWRCAPEAGDSFDHYPFIYFDNGATTAIRSTHDNTLATRWVMRERGIALDGPPASFLIDPIDPGALRTEVSALLDKWIAEMLANPQFLETHWYQAFTVVSLCRMLQTIETCEMHSKLAGAAWGKANLDPRWSDLIERSWAERLSDRWANVFHQADAQDVALTLEFVKYVRALG